MSFFADVKGDVRNFFVNMLLGGIVVIVGAAGAALYKSSKEQAVPWMLLIAIAAVGLALVAIATALIWKNYKAKRSDAPARPLYAAIEQLKRLLAEGDQMANMFQVPSAPKPTFKRIVDWHARVNRCAKQDVLAERIDPSDIRKFNEKWDAGDVLRIETLLHDVGYFDNVDSTGRIAFRYIWGFVKRLEELIENVERAPSDHVLVMTQRTEELAAQLAERSELRRWLIRAKANIETIDRRATEIQAGIDVNWSALGLMDSMKVTPTKEMMGVVTGGPTPIEPIEGELISAADEIDRELGWQAYRDLANAARHLNRGIAKHNEDPQLAFCTKLYERVEAIRKLKVVIEGERTERESAASSRFG